MNMLRLIFVLGLMVMISGCAKEIHEASAADGRANVQHSSEMPAPSFES